ncbi:TetR/AcrR family transcriptional regulator [Phenylobacterium sp.]|uniref:TetR/AcrR family transcriptional regulator n=1 Tax=Phenylobacterium sp. TaxID=1871053 RepID=UPI0025E5A17A|nr:TetR/AcrR family transcriptional regulator [Phenylobacterium sp.]
MIEDEGHPRLVAERGLLRVKSPRYAQARGEARRLLLYRTALRLLREKHVEDITYQEIAREAGVPLASCYHFFPGKMELMAALIDHVGPWFRTVTVAAVLKPVKSWIGVVDNLIMDITTSGNSDLAFAQLFTSWKIPRTSYRFHDYAAREIAGRILAGIDRQFVRPRFADELEVFTFAMRIVSAGVAPSMEIHGSVTDFARAEAQRATTSYLLNFCPLLLDRREAPIETPELALPDPGLEALWAR